MAELRDYQQELLEQVEAALRAPKSRVMLQLPTGGGKTHIAGALLACWLRDGRKAVWLTHRAELSEQTRRMLNDARVSVINNLAWRVGDEAPYLRNGVVILMAQTVGRRTNNGKIWDIYDSDDLLVIDEAHHATADGWERAIKQWPGRILGMTATPWRLSRTEGFNHLFDQLYCGPQIRQLRADGWLCKANVLVPTSEKMIRGGAIAATGDYNESGIERANEDRPDVMTAGALRFWQFHTAGRPTIVYAISKDHANNLTAVFNDAGIPAAVMLSDTPLEERSRAIESFGNGTIRVLVNVAVATEGFDLPDASCVVITRPTMSLALYLQMVGRGLRPKSDGGYQDCLILDLAGNAGIHGLPEEEREWSLLPRGTDPGGEAPVVRCDKCDGVSPAASYICVNCGAPFGKDCSRCGKWRAWERWSYENHCGNLHELVCDLCHYDAHIQAQLPVTDELRELAELDNSEEEEMVVELGSYRDSFLRDLLDEERRRMVGADDEREDELGSLISTREAELADDNELEKAFEQDIANLPLQERPQSGPEKHRLYNAWEDGIKRELADWKDELAKLEARVVDGQLIYNNARERVLQLLEAEAREAGLLPQKPVQEAVVSTPENFGAATADINRWLTFVQMGEWGGIEPTTGTPVKPLRFRDPKGIEISVQNWALLLSETADWLVREGLIVGSKCPVTVGNMRKRYLIHSTPLHPQGQRFVNDKRLSNGLHLESSYSAKGIARLCGQLLAEFGQDPAKFHVLLR